MNLLRNPEFIRNAWLELTPQRLLATPAILGLVFLVAYLIAPNGPQVPQVALALFAALTILWGAKLAGESIAEEFSQGTWDTQRLSGLSAWQMSAGKLFGGPIFAWFGGAICALVLLAFTPAAGFGHALRTLSIAAGIAVTFHAIALMSNLMVLRKLPRQATRPRTRGAMLLLALLVVPQMILALMRAPRWNDVQWYGHTFAALDFALLCTALAVFWSVLGLYRAMRQELAFRDAPLAWIGFLLFLCAFSGGWFYGQGQKAPLLVDPGAPPVLRHLALCVAFIGGAAYALLFAERKDWLRLRRMTGLWRAGQRGRAFALMPKWLVTVALCAMAVLAFCAAALLGQPVLDGIAESCTALALLALLVRDAAIVLGLNFTPDQRRADAAAGIYVALLYLLLPALLRGLKLGVALPAVWPLLVVHQPVWLVACLFQAAAALEFALLRWRKLPT
ncbi:MAG: hypothetical protein ISP90_18990 [Nevskia sp.]|nr:hypothetical protein [Nevskia sp.]